MVIGGSFQTRAISNFSRDSEEYGSNRCGGVAVRSAFDDGLGPHLWHSLYLGLLGQALSTAGALADFPQWLDDVFVGAVRAQGYAAAIGDHRAGRRWWNLDARDQRALHDRQSKACRSRGCDPGLP